MTGRKRLETDLKNILRKGLQSSNSYGNVRGRGPAPRLSPIQRKPVGLFSFVRHGSLDHISRFVRR